ncbi:MAG: YihY family inner membrane protein [Gallionellaceae bacterium]|jgi:membrane protein|nr:YihY family inner membrane protein [Gallionellaceae bacterium]
MSRTWKDLQSLLRFVAARFMRDRCVQIAGSLTFTTLLSLVPLITIALTLFSASPMFDEFATNIKRFMLANMPHGTGVRTLTRYITQFAESASQLTVIGIAFLGVTSVMLIQTIEDAFNTIWRVTKPRKFGRRILISGAVLVLIPILVGGSLTLTSWLVGLSLGYASAMPMFKVILLKIVPLILTTLAFTLLFHFVPNRHVPMRHAFIGGLAAAIAFEAMSQGFGYYISNFPTYKLVYGAFASVPVFLMWIYFSWMAVLAGALLAASLPYWRGSPTNDPSSALRLYQAVRTLTLMDAGQRDGNAPTLRKLAAHSRIGFDALEYILDKLTQAGMVKKLTGKGWGLARKAEDIPLEELYRAFVFDPTALPASLKDARIKAWFDETEKRASAGAKTLRDLIES